MSMKVQYSLYDIVDMFLEGSIDVEADCYTSRNDYFTDQIEMRLNYLKSEYKKCFDTGKREEARNFRSKIADIMPGYVLKGFLEG